MELIKINHFVAEASESIETIIKKKNKSFKQKPKDQYENLTNLLFYRINLGRENFVDIIQVKNA